MDSYFDSARETISQPIVAATGLAFLLTAGVFYLSIRIFRFSQQLRLKRVWLEITPPANTTATLQSASQLFTVIHGIRGTQTVLDRLLLKPILLSFEITSTKSEGIKYLLYAPESMSDSISKHISTYVPGARVVQIKRTGVSFHKVISFKQTNNFLYPLAAIEEYDPDPLAYVLDAMTNQSPNESITYQIVIQPINNSNLARTASQILRNENEIQRSHVQSVGGRGLRAIGRLLTSLANVASEVISGSLNGHRQTISQGRQPAGIRAVAKSNDRPSRTISTFEQELLSSINDKVQQPLFRVNLRVATIGSQSSAVRSMKAALTGFNNPIYQSITSRSSFPILSKLHRYFFTMRLPAIRYRNSLLLSSSELAGLYHFVARSSGVADNLQASLAKTLPAPVSLKKGNELDVYIGVNEHHGVSTSIGLTDKERERHMYIIGGTGNGKTTLLQYQIIQDIEKGRGIAVVDPHGDMAEFIIDHIPESRIEDVIYFNPSDFEYPVGLNLLELTPGLEGNPLLHEKDLVTESLVSVFRKIFSDEDSGGHRIEYVLRNAVQTALTVEDATIFTVFELLNNPRFRKKIVSNLEDYHLKNFWVHEIGKAGEMQRVKMGAGITSKIGRFLFSASARQILGQAKSTINFEDIINSKKILICNLSKGNIGEDTSELFGITILAKLQLASLKRASLPLNERVPFYLYVDEFQNFATQSFVQMLSESRKYKLALIMAEQSTSQQSDQQMINIILANVGTVISFKTGNPADERLLLPLFSPYIAVGEISNLPAYNFYAKISAIKSQEPLSGVTILVDGNSKRDSAKHVIQQSRKKYTGVYIPTQTTVDTPDKKPRRPKPKTAQKLKLIDD